MYVGMYWYLLDYLVVWLQYVMIYCYVGVELGIGGYVVDFDVCIGCIQMQFLVVCIDFELCLGNVEFVQFWCFVVVMMWVMELCFQVCVVQYFDVIEGYCGLVECCGGIEQF